MGSYHSSFTYLGQNSFLNHKLIIASFEPDSGFVDTYLGMDQIVTESYDGTKKHFYGNKYNSSAEILITLVKPDGSDFSMQENRDILRWLTGNRGASWLDLYTGEQELKNHCSNISYEINYNPVYCFYGSVTACQQQKMDGRVIGIQITFSSIHPWAWSNVKNFNCFVGEKTIGIDYTGAIYKTYGDSEEFGVTKNGVLYNNDNETSELMVTDDGVVYNESAATLQIENSSDDLYTYTNLDIMLINQGGDSISIRNNTTGEESIIKGLETHEVVMLSAGQFITSYNFAYDEKHITPSTRGTYYISKLDDEYDIYIYEKIELPKDYEKTFVGELIGDGKTTTFKLDTKGFKNFTLKINGEISREWEYTSSKDVLTITFSNAPGVSDKIEVFCSVYYFEQNLNKIFGDAFNFVWPRLVPGKNELIIDGAGKSSAHFSYRYPIKIGDCAIDIT